LEPAKTIDIQPWMTDADTRAVMGALAAPDMEGPAALFVGGCVRDTLMGRDVVDIDIATAHPPDEVVRRLETAGIGYHTNGIDHGTVAAHGEDRLLEITTLRVDVETHGRHATVAYTDDWTADAARRDFTINALYMDMDGHVFDPLGGMADVDARRVRFIGDANERIHEDALRILRFFRFHAQLDVSVLDPDGLAACRDNAALLDNLSGERIRDELFKLLVAPGAMRMLDNEAYPEMLQVLFPGLPNVFAGEGLSSLIVIEQDHDRPDPLRRLVAVVENWPWRKQEAAVAIRSEMELMSSRLRLSKSDSRRVVKMIERPRGLTPERTEVRPFVWSHLEALLPTPRMWSLRRRISEEKNRDRRYFAELYVLDDTAWRDAVLLNWAAHAAEVLEASVEGARMKKIPDDAWLDLLKLPERKPRPEYPLQGRDVLDLGVPQGPEISRLLGEVEQWWIDGGFVADRKTCLAELKRRAKR